MQLVRTSSDMIRLVPMIVILVVPFAEFALPVLLKVSGRCRHPIVCVHSADVAFKGSQSTDRASLIETGFPELFAVNF
jgi:hypothetical protein